MIDILLATGVILVSLKLQDVSVSYNGRGRVLDRVSFSIDNGGIACILGPTGCGKTTTLKAISGIVPIDEGTISIDGKRVGDPESVSIGYVFQEHRLLPWRSVVGNVEFSMEPGSRDGKVIRSRAEQLLGMVGMEDHIDSNPSVLSGGEKQRVAIARALAPDPTLLLADEPFGSLDVTTRRRILELFRSVVEGVGKTTVFVTHDLFEALYLADRLIVYSDFPARVKASIPIEDGRPRNLSSPRMIELRERVVSLLGDGA
jgi:NitT/TauT family transport system ATP-binding protein